MKDKILGALSCVALTLTALPTTLQAQHEDIRKRSAAHQACNVDGWLGYSSYDLCVDLVYQDLMNQEYSGVDWEYYYGLNYGCSAESRICKR